MNEPVHEDGGFSNDFGVPVRQRLMEVDQRRNVYNSRNRSRSNDLTSGGIGENRVQRSSGTTRTVTQIGAIVERSDDTGSCAENAVMTKQVGNSVNDNHNSTNGTRRNAVLKEKPWNPPANWVLAPEFVPSSSRAWAPNASELVPVADVKSRDSTSTSVLGAIPTVKPNRTYAQVVSLSCATTHVTSVSGSNNGSGDGKKGAPSTKYEMCPYAMVGECRYGAQCLLVHGTRCDFCGQACLHPTDMQQRDNHIHECIRQHERDMEHSFAVARSSDKTCGVCMEVIMEKTPVGEQRFGILPSCNHCFCLSCIRKWRKARQFENKIIRACPECRVTSDFVCPSRFWVDSKEEKEKLISSYKVALSQKACRYYRSGEGTCPFGNKCFYRHALPNGNQVDVGPPRRRRRRNGGGGSSNANSAISVWEFLDDWELQWLDIDDFMDMESDSEFSDDDEFEEYFENRNWCCCGCHVYDRNEPGSRLPPCLWREAMGFWE